MTDPAVMFEPLSDDEREAALAVLPPSPTSDGWEVISPVPDDAPQQIPPHRLGKPTRIWVYRNEVGERLFVVCRFDKSEGGKEIFPLTYCQDAQGNRDWRWKGYPAPRPLYHLDELAAKPEAPVLIIEGEKTADAAKTLFPDYVATTCSGGARAAAKTDWGPLRGRRVTVWPDHDGAGRQYADDVLKLVREAGAACFAIVSVPGEFPEGWDVADPPPDGCNNDRLQELVNTDQPFAANAADAAAVEPPRPLTREMAPPGSKGASWPNPDMSLLAPTQFPAPVWEDSYLPPYWAKFAKDTAAAKNAPVDFVALPLLATASALIGNARRARPYSDWLEPPNLWMATVGLPGTGKTPAAQPIFEALAAIERESLPDFEQRYADYQRDFAEFDGRQEVWRAEVKKAVKSGKAPPDFDAVEPHKPMEPCLSANDATLEKLCLLLRDEPKGLLYRRDELAGWMESMNRYGGGGDRPFWLEAWSGGAYVQHRVKHDKPIRIPRLALSIFGTTQPEKVAKMLTDADDGLIGRFLWSKPDRVPYQRPTASSDADGAKTALRRLAKLALDTSADGEPVPRIIPFDEAAANVVDVLASQMDERLDSVGGLMVGTVAKMRGQMVRLALTLTYLDWCAGDHAEPTEVSKVEVVMAANAVVEYFLPMARRVFEDAALPEGERDAAAIARWIRKTGQTAVNARSLERDEVDGWHGTRDRNRIRDALITLADANIVASPSGTGKIGRPRVDFPVNPKFIVKE